MVLDLPALTQIPIDSLSGEHEGEGVGVVGETGNAAGTGCHLHFEIHERGEPINPEAALRRWDRYS